jgi:hypothetical protein
MTLEEALTQLAKVARRLNRELEIKLIDPHLWSIEFELVGWRTFMWSSFYDFPREPIVSEVVDGVLEFTNFSDWIDGLLDNRTRNDAGEMV